MGVDFGGGVGRQVDISKLNDNLSGISKLSSEK